MRKEEISQHSSLQRVAQLQELSQSLGVKERVATLFIIFHS